MPMAHALSGALTGTRHCRLHARASHSSRPSSLTSAAAPAAAAAAAARQCSRHARAGRQPALLLVRSSVKDSPAEPAGLDDVDEAAAEAAVRAGWDPQNLLPPMDGPVDHFSRRARQRQQQQQQEQPQGQEHQPQEQPQGQPQEQQQQPASQLEPQPAAAQSAYTTAAHQQQPPAPAPAQQQQQQQQEQAPQQAPKQQQQQERPQQQQQQAAEAAPAPAPAPAGGGPILVVPQPPGGAFASSDAVQRIPARFLAQGGIPAADGSAYNRPAFVEKLAEKFMPLDLDFPGLRIVNYDPAILTVEGFMSPQECKAWQHAAQESGCLQQSKIGGGNAASAAGAGSVNVYGARRTSSSLLMDPATQAKSPALAALMASMQGRAYKLLAHLDGGRSWGPPGRMPAGGQFCFESPQVARYETGQHFLAHEDGFPPLLAASNGFQRHATLLLYLNDVQQGGATHFDHLGISVQPRQGTALLFFPARADGTPDARTLHTAQDALDTKWVMQQWIARGYPTPKAVLKAVKVAALAGPEAPAAREGAPAEREVFRVAASSSSSSSASSGYASKPPGKAKRKKGGGGGGGKKGFSRR